MKSIGIVRRVDNLGRIVIPKETRKMLGILIRDPIEILIEGDRILLRKYVETCSMCGKNEELQSIGNLKLCRACIQIITEHNKR
ncbi:AbrB/MazE/SpoVT family DNA-binding domain-containing protein [uncultured Oscillibacter sp.]|uniref:AbrB/MazE/SpoVT family DNA-binding domain-containing protein n=1 Tax=uncultured Oscillibacter sp. TaxID=876091 RepID=UPI002604C299|nr:AbrB/MazE/SpoVT family DNA-binding domain-containing protein [uncultured Oscillibacter sp.]